MEIDEAAAEVAEVMAALEGRRAEVDAERLAAQRHETEVLRGYAAAVAEVTRAAQWVSELETMLTAARKALAHATEHRRAAVGALLALPGRSSEEIARIVGLDVEEVIGQGMPPVDHSSPRGGLGRGIAGLIPTGPPQ